MAGNFFIGFMSLLWMSIEVSRCVYGAFPVFRGISLALVASVMGLHLGFNSAMPVFHGGLMTVHERFVVPSFVVLARAYMALS